MPFESVQEFDYESYINQLGKGNPGPMLYFEPFDWKVRGMPKRFVIVGGFSGSYKTTFALNIAYNNAIALEYNVCFLSLEMPSEDLKLRLAVRHAQNPKFMKFNQVIKISDVVQGNLSADAKRFLFNEVIPDLKNNRKYGRIFVLESSDIAEYSTAGLEYALMAIEKKLQDELGAGGKTDIHLFIIDYLQLVGRYANAASAQDRFFMVQQVARAMKELTQMYAIGRGITIIALSQMTRAAYQSVVERVRNARRPSEKYDNLYDLTAFAESSELANSADIAVTIFSDDELKKLGHARVQLVKNRYGEPLEQGVNAFVSPDVCYFGDIPEEPRPDSFVGSLLADVL
jgi:replicative DNA helicase